MFPPLDSFGGNLSETPYGDQQPTTSGLPHSREAEEAVIGAVLINPNTFYEIKIVISHGGPLEFYIHRLRFIWEAFVRLDERRMPVDILTVSEELDNMGRLDEIGGQAYLTALLNQTPTTLHAWAYAKMMDACYVRRLLLTGANQIATLAYDAEMEIDDVVEKSIAATKPAIQANLPDSMVSAKEAVRKTDADNERARQTGVLPGIRTGFFDIDLKLGGGIQKGEYLLVAGRPGTGKTSWMLQVVDYVSLVMKKNVVVFSLEMAKEQLINRWISQITGIDSQLIRAGMVPAFRMPEYYAALEKINNSNVIFDDAPRLTPSMLRAKLEVCSSLDGVDLVCLDYLALLTPEMKYSSPVERINDFSRECKSISREFGISFLGLAQMNRNIEHRDKTTEPELSDLNEGGEKDPDTVAFLHHEKDDEDNILRSYFKAAKARNGPTGKVFLKWEPTITKYSSITVPTVSTEA